MDTPFTDNEDFGIDLEKRIRRTDKQTAALIGTWYQGEPIVHFDLYPDTARVNLKQNQRRENAAVASVDPGFLGLCCADCCPARWRRRPPRIPLARADLSATSATTTTAQPLSARLLESSH